MTSSSGKFDSYVVVTVTLLSLPQAGASWPLFRRGLLTTSSLAHFEIWKPPTKYTVNPIGKRKTGGRDHTVSPFCHVTSPILTSVVSHLSFKVSETCVATVGRVSNVDHNKRIIGKAGRNRWLGIRPSSGLWKRKGGWAGRKIKPLPPIKSYVKLPSAGPPVRI
ncbi:large ribosomal subunit protein uL2m [Pyxicephalus adspersus]|uniref:large ribosomal subunit protein uL2m n=1 Tax=Pyxicephalus adspersus TaxID=30357 RepID=UPI003B5B4F4B